MSVPSGVVRRGGSAAERNSAAATPARRLGSVQYARAPLFGEPGASAAHRSRLGSSSCPRTVLPAPAPAPAEPERRSAGGASSPASAASSQAGSSTGARAAPAGRRTAGSGRSGGGPEAARGGGARGAIVRRQAGDDRSSWGARRVYTSRMSPACRTRLAAQHQRTEEAEPRRAAQDTRVRTDPR